MSIYELSAVELKSKLEARELSAVEIVTALRERKAQVDGDVNAMVLDREAALKEAKRYDESNDKSALGPLAGLPITLKDNVELAGTDSTMGLPRLVNQPADKDSVVAAAVRRTGAIIIGKTNVPQLLMAQETENTVFGTTNNPWDRTRVPGGSSGGEAAAIASGSSVFGIGTDIGGSIRTPAHFCGITGLKPTLDRWSNRGSRSGILGQELVRAQIGPMARNVADLELLWRAMDPEWQATQDPFVPPIAVGDPASIDLSSLRIGYWDDDDFMSPVPALRRAVRQAVAALESAGATLVPHRPVPSQKILFTWMAGVSSDGGQSLDKALGGEPYSPQLKPSRALMRLPGPARRALAKVMRATGDGRVAQLLEVLGQKPVYDFWQLTQQRTEMRRAELDSWQDKELDAFVCPSHVVPAMKHRESSDFVLSLGPQVRWTTLNFPAGIVPIGKIRESEVGSIRGGDRLDKKQASIDAGSAGLPTSVQVVARPFAEDVCLRVMGAIEAGVRGDEEFPVTPIDPR